MKTVTEQKSLGLLQSGVGYNAKQCSPHLCVQSSNKKIVAVSGSYSQAPRGWRRRQAYPNSTFQFSHSLPAGWSGHSVTDSSTLLM